MKTLLRKDNVALLVGCLLWLSLTGYGFLFLLSYERLPGPKAHVPAVWPGATKLEAAHGDFTLIMFLHPKCSCSNASLTELSVLMTRRPELKAYVLVLRPANAPSDWEKGALWQRATRIPGVTVLSDPSGRESGVFNARSSGTTIVYDPAGKLVFNGGITDGRGHEGDNQGLDTIQTILARAQASRSETPVFGCALADNPHPNGEVLYACHH